MPKRDPLPKEVITAAAKMFATGKASRTKAAALGVPAHRYPSLKAAADAEIEVFRTCTGGILRRTATKMAKRFERDADTLPIGQIPIALAVTLDKERALRESVPASQSLHLHIKGDSGSALRAILGPAADRVFQPRREEPVPVIPLDPDAS